MKLKYEKKKNTEESIREKKSFGKRDWPDKTIFFDGRDNQKKKKKYATRTCPTFRKARRNFAEVLLVIS